VWSGPREGDEISVLDDFAIDARYLAVRSNSEATARSVRDALARSLNPRTISELREQAAADPRALTILALALDTIDDASGSVIESALASTDPGVRGEAIIAASLTRSTRFRSALQKLAEVTSDERERAMIDAAIAACM